MKSKYTRLLLIPIFISSLFYICGAMGGAWVLPKGMLYTKTEYQSYRSCRYWTMNGSLTSGPCYHQYQINPLIEYGASDRWTVGVKPFFREIEVASHKDPMGLDNAEFLARYLLWAKDYDALSIQVGENIPFRDNRINNASVASATILPFALSQRQNFTDFRVLYGIGGIFGKRNYGQWYADFQFAFRPYYDGAADEFHLDLTQAWKSRENRVQIILKELYTQSLHNPHGAGQPNYDLLSIEPSILIWLKRHNVGVQVGVLQDVYGKNVGKGTTPFIALWLTTEKPGMNYESQL